MSFACGINDEREILTVENTAGNDFIAQRKRA